MLEKSKNELTPPPIAENARAVEVLRVWEETEAAQQLVLKTTWEEPGAWGVLLAEARHVGMDTLS